MSPSGTDSLSSMLRKSGVLLWHCTTQAEPWPLLIKVAGRSMVPALAPGDWILVRKSSDGLPQPGEVVIIRHPVANEKILVKRVRSNGQKTFSVGSDNPFEGSDSRHFGSLPAEACLGRVVGCWRPSASRLAGALQWLSIGDPK